MKLVYISLLLCVSWSHTAEEWSSRTIYQIVTDRFARGNGDYSPCTDLSNYCGGTFKGIEENLDYIEGMGFDAIWISPVLKNSPGSYHGYATIDFYSINPYFGTEDDLTSLISACHRRDIWVMFDVVANHVGPVSNYSEINPFNLSSYYHPYCQINDWNNQTEVENCWLFVLPDLDQSNPYVKQTLLSWINWLVNKFDVDGLRIDTAVEVPKLFWKQFSMYAGVYTMGEAFNGDVNYVAGYQGPLDGTLNYPLFFSIRDWFQSDKDLFSVRDFMSSEKAFYNENWLGAFVDNHDNARFLYEHSNKYRFMNALAWSLTTLGIPIVYYGDEQGFNGGNDPLNREILWSYLNNTDSEYYVFLQKVIKFRKDNKIWLYQWIERYAGHHFYCFSRGQALMAFSNTDSDQTYEITYHPYSEGEVVCNVIWEGDCVTVTNGALKITLLHGEVKLFEPKISQLTYN